MGKLNKFFLISLPLIFGGLAFALTVGELALQLKQKLQASTSASSFPQKKTQSLVAIGESSLYGEPYDGKIDILKILGPYVDDKNWQFFNYGVKGRSLDSLMGEGLRQLEEKRPKVFLAYVGHNEFQTANLNGAHCPGQWVLPCPPASLLCKFISDRIGIIQHGLRQKKEVRPQDFFGSEAFCLDERRSIIDQFEKNLSVLAQKCRDQGSQFILLFPPALEKGLTPNRSFYRGEENKKAQFKKLYQEGMQKLNQGELVLALEKFITAKEIDGRWAHLLYHEAEVREQLGQNEAAAKLYRQAINEDTFPSRAQEDLWLAFLRVKKKFPEIVLLDGRQVLKQASPHGIVDFTLFHDLQHPNLRGYHHLALALKQTLQDLSFIPRHAEENLLSEDELAQKFNFQNADWFGLYYSRVKWFEMMSYRAFEPSDRYQAMIHNLKEARSFYKNGYGQTQLDIPGLGKMKIPLSNLDQFEKLALSLVSESKVYEK